MTKQMMSMSSQSLIHLGGETFNFTTLACRHKNKLIKITGSRASSTTIICLNSSAKDSIHNGISTLFFYLPMNYLATISNLGDIAATAPAAACIALFFIMQRAWQLAIWWIILFFCGLVLVVVSKLAFAGWGIGYQALNFTGFSGHAMRAMAILPVLGYLVAKNNPRTAQITMLIISACAGTVIGISRLLLHVHSWSEVIAGWVLGTVVSFLFILILRNWNNNSFYPPMIVIAVAAFMPFVITPRFTPTPTQDWIIALSLYLSGRDQPFTRDDWRFSPPSQAANTPSKQARTSSNTSRIYPANKIFVEMPKEYR